MIITGRRIRNLDRHFAAIPDGQTVVVGIAGLERFSQLLTELGFSAGLPDGETILPPASTGPVSLFNAEGREMVHRDQPMETAYRTVEWRWNEWHGRYDSVPQSRLVDVPYQRYPRTPIPPPSIELTLATTTDGRRLLRTPQVTYEPTNAETILHRVNLFLEIFQEAEVFTGNLDTILPATIRRVNWHILPQGRSPWSQLRNELDPIINREPQGNQPVIRYRLETVNSYEPDFVAVGRGGFQGYVIFGFPQRDLYVLECAHTGNATYVLGERWEELSQRSKAEILDERSHVARLIHRDSWATQLAETMGSQQRPARRTNRR